MVSSDTLAALLSPELRSRLRLRVCASVPSTNAAVKQIALEGEGEGYVLLSEAQTEGHGRFARAFHSPVGGLYMSILLRPRLSAVDALGITTAAAVAVAEAVEALGGVSAQIKWVNDVLVGGRKVAGILAEGGIMTDGGGYVVLGIGVNVSPPMGGFPSALAPFVGTVLSAPLPDAVERLAAAVLSRFFAYYDDLAARPHYAAYAERLAWVGQQVRVYRGREAADKQGGEVAVLLGIGEDFSLRLSQNGKEIRLSSGEVSLSPLSP